jgi:hypothetical protein
MDKTRLQCFGALYGNGSPPSSDEIAFQLEKEKAQAAYEESEQNHQIRLHDWLNDNNIPHYAPYNEGHMMTDDAARTGRRAKRMGMSPGICDMVITRARKPHHGLYIELKARPHGRVSGAQEWWLKTLVFENYKAVVSWSFEESLQIVQDYLLLPAWTD